MKTNSMNLSMNSMDLSMNSMNLSMNSMNFSFVWIMKENEIQLKIEK